MARTRSLKPSFFRDSKVVSLPFEARLLFQGMWCIADYKGRFKYEPLELKMEIFPADNVDIEQCVSALDKSGLIEIYREHSGATLVQIVGFEKHQNPHVNEKQDKQKNPLPHLPSKQECEQGAHLSVENVGDEKDDIDQKVKDALVVLREYSESNPAYSLNPLTLTLNPVTGSCSAPPALRAQAHETEPKPKPKPKPKPAEEPDPKPTTSSVDGNPNSARRQKRKSPTALASAVGPPDGVSDGEWLEYLVARRDNPKSPEMTDNAVRRFAAAVTRAANDTGLGSAEVIRLVVARNWTGVQSDWVRNAIGKRGAGPPSGSGSGASRFERIASAAENGENPNDPPQREDFIEGEMA